MVWYILGSENHLGCTDKPPRIVNMPRPSMLWQSQGSVSRVIFGIKAGRADESYRDPYDPSVRVVARELPEDAEPELLRLREQIELAEAALVEAKANLQDFLAAQVPRSRVARVPSSSS